MANLARDPVLTRPVVAPRVNQHYQAPNLNTSTLAPVTQAPFVGRFTDQIRARPVKQPTDYNNLLSNTLYASSQLSPFFLDLGQPTIARAKPQQIYSVNLQTTTLAPAVGGAPFKPTLFDQVRAVRDPLVDQFPNLITSTLFTSTQQAPFNTVMVVRGNDRRSNQIDQPPNLLTSELFQATQQNPFQPYQWPTARAVAPTRQVDWYNLLSNTLAAPVVVNPFVPYQWPSARSTPPIRQVDNLNLLTSTLAPVVVVNPFVPYDWPIARGRKVQQPDLVGSFNVLQPAEAPVFRWDWQNPVLARRVAQPIAPQNELTLTLSLPNIQPPTPYMWPQAHPAPRPVEQWAFHYPLPLGIPLITSRMGGVDHIFVVQASNTVYRVSPVSKPKKV